MNGLRQAHVMTSLSHSSELIRDLALMALGMSCTLSKVSNY